MFAVLKESKASQERGREAVFQCVVLHVCSVSHVWLSWLTPKRGAQPRARLLSPLFYF